MYAVTADSVRKSYKIQSRFACSIAAVMRYDLCCCIVTCFMLQYLRYAVALCCCIVTHNNMPLNVFI